MGVKKSKESWRCFERLGVDGRRQHSPSPLSLPQRKDIQEVNWRHSKENEQCFRSLVRVEQMTEMRGTEVGEGGGEKD